VSQDAILFQKIAEGVLLLPIQPAGEDAEHKPKSRYVDHGRESISPVQRFGSTSARVVGHYASGTAESIMQNIRRRTGKGFRPWDYAPYRIRIEDSGKVTVRPS
jgi:hypothetical protein